MKDSRRIWVWVGVVVVVVAVAVAIVWRPAPPKATGPVPVFAPQGQVVAQFPQGLLLGGSTAVTGSYSINYSTSTNQYTAQYNSSSTVKALFANYQSYFSANKWTVTKALSSSPIFDMIVANQGSGKAQVTIAPRGKGSAVTISYVTSE